MCLGSLGMQRPVISKEKVLLKKLGGLAGVRQVCDLQEVLLAGVRQVCNLQEVLLAGVRQVCDLQEVLLASVRQVCDLQETLLVPVGKNHQVKCLGGVAAEWTFAGCPCLVWL